MNRTYPHSCPGVTPLALQVHNGAVLVTGTEPARHLEGLLPKKAVSP